MSRLLTIFFLCWSLSVLGQTSTPIKQDTVIYQWEDDEEFTDFGEDDDEGEDGYEVQDSIAVVKKIHPPIKKDIVKNDSSLLSQNVFFQRDSLNNILHPWTDTLYWESLHSHYIIFDSMAVNPYKVSPSKYKDTITIFLYDSLKGNWSMPLTNHRITSNFGPRGSRFHYGIDIGLSIGDSVLSVFDGIVRISKVNPGGYGNYVLVRHYNGLETVYGHLNERLVKVGQHVKAGELIGYGGNTGRSSGPHLHFEVRYQGNAMNPTSIYKFESDTILCVTFHITSKNFTYYSTQVSRATYHRVQSGETLWGIAKKYKVSVNQICRLNGISSRTVLKVGRRLRIR